MEYVILSIMIVAGIGYFVIRFKTASLQLHFELDQKRKQVEEQAAANLLHRNQILNEKQEIENLLRHNRSILKDNDKILKKNSNQLYHIKRDVALLYDHYNRIIELSNDLMKGNGIDFKSIDRVKRDAEYHSNTIDNYFFNVFRMTIEEHKKEQTNIVAYPKKDNNEGLMGLITESSLN